ERADHLAPGLARTEYAGTAAVVAAAPVVQQRRRAAGVDVEVAGQLDLGGAAAEVFDRRVDEPQADVVLRARPAVGGGVELHGRVVVLVLDLSGVAAGVEPAVLFPVV